MAHVQPSRRGHLPDHGRIERGGDVGSSLGAHAGDDGRVERGDAAIARLAARQHGVVGRRQLLALGVSREAIQHRVEARRLHLLHRGVYAVGHAAVTPSGASLAAVLACGRGAVLSHGSAAVIWGLLPARDSAPEVTVPRSRRVVRPGITVHRTDDLSPADVRIRDGIPVTTPERTLLDLAATAGTTALGQALNEALLKRLTNPTTLLTRAVRRPGARAIRAALDHGPTPTRSEAERRLLSLIEKAGLPRPQTNARIGRFEVDAVWRKERVIVEVDGYAFHSGRAAFERDRQRDATLQAAGYRVLRVTWRQLTERPETVIAQLAALLAPAGTAAA